MVEATEVAECGWLDYDQDGSPDLYLAQGGDPATLVPADQLH